MVPTYQVTKRPEQSLTPYCKKSEWAACGGQIEINLIVMKDMFTKNVMTASPKISGF
jgi:hypothetical protein